MTAYTSKKIRSNKGFRLKSSRLLDQVHEVMRYHHYGRRTEEAYIYWIRQFILFHNKRHPKDMNKAEIEAFLSHLAVEKDVAASTQNQAFNASVSHSGSDQANISILLHFHQNKPWGHGLNLPFLCSNECCKQIRVHAICEHS